MVSNNLNVVVVTDEEKLKMLEDISRLPEKDKYFILGIIQGKLLDKAHSSDDSMTSLA